MDRDAHHPDDTPGPDPTSAVSDALLALDLARGLGPRGARRLLDVFETAECLLGAASRDLQEHTGCTLHRADAIRAALESGLGRVDLERAALDRVGGRLVACGSSEFPHLLEAIPDPPLVMRVRGSLPGLPGPTARPALAIVGSRRPTTYGCRQARRFAEHFSDHGVHVVSGGARGIDGVCHRAALERAGGTTAILGSGLGCPYPPEHAGLFDLIVANGGCVASEYPVDATPRPDRFPRRNRVVSGLAVGVLVVEAAARSGALITARLAIEEQGREAMAIPGRVDDPRSAGCLRMLKEGWAALVRSPEDAVEALDGARFLLADRSGESSRDPAPGELPG